MIKLRVDTHSDGDKSLLVRTPHILHVRRISYSEILGDIIITRILDNDSRPAIYCPQTIRCYDFEFTENKDELIFTLSIYEGRAKLWSGNWGDEEDEE